MLTRVLNFKIYFKINNTRAFKCRQILHKVQKNRYKEIHVFSFMFKEIKLFMKS